MQQCRSVIRPSEELAWNTSVTVGHTREKGNNAFGMRFADARVRTDHERKSPSMHHLWAQPASLSTWPNQQCTDAAFRQLAVGDFDVMTTQHWHWLNKLRAPSIGLWTSTQRDGTSLRDVMPAIASLAPVAACRLLSDINSCKVHVYLTLTSEPQRNRISIHKRAGLQRVTSNEWRFKFRGE